MEKLVASSVSEMIKNLRNAAFQCNNAACGYSPGEPERRDLDDLHDQIEKLLTRAMDFRDEH
jgi:hypothetical protein